MKHLHLHCPYCRAPVVRRRSRDLFGQSARDPDALYYVCAQYPHCDAYVSAHRKSGLPMGTLADPALRRKRIQTHQVFDRIWKDGPLSKKQAYRWLQGALGLPESQAHIGCFSHYQCDRIIALCADHRQAGRLAA